MSKSLIEMVREKRDALVKPANDAIASAEDESRDLTPEESTAVDTAASDEVRALDARIVQLTELAGNNARAAAELPQVKVRKEEDTYRRNGDASFFRDLYARQFNFDNGAADRLRRHEQFLQTEVRDTVVSGMGGMIPPLYLTDLYAPTARAGRPFLNALNSRPLPSDGVSFYIPRGTTTATGGFVTEGASFIEVDSSVATDNQMVALVGAFTDLSRTVFERGGAVVDEIIMQDLIDISEVAEDKSAINGTAAPLGFTGVLSSVPTANKVAYTDASPTVAEMWPKVADAIQRVQSGRFMPATAIFMTPARWGWITAALDTQNRPLFNFTVAAPGVPYMGLGSNLLYGQIVGTLQGLPVITDANIPATWASGVASTSGTEDVIIVARTPDIVLMEDSMMRFTFEQAPPTAPGQVRLAAGRFAMFYAGRYPNGLASITGTGLTTPSF
jgi:HK97 family phage major capsid protein